MPLVLPNEGLVDQLAYMVKEPISGVLPWQLRLWSNNLTPGQATVLADLTECTFTGYSRVTMTRSSWQNFEVITNRARAQWGSSATSWTCTGSPQTVYGYAMVDTALGVIRGVERFDTPQVLATGGVLSVLPRYSYTTNTSPGP